MHLPGPGDGSGVTLAKADAPEKLTTNNRTKGSESPIEGNGLWPLNIELLRTRGVAFTWRQAEHDLRMSCPHCAGVLVLHEEKPWHFCNGIACSGYLFTFSEIVAALPVDQNEVTP